MSIGLETQLKIAEYLLQIKAIKLQPKNPFTWASGLKSPIYCDNRITLSYPVIRTYIRQQLVHLIQEEFGNPTLIAGVATAGIPQGILVAQELGLPFAYVRASTKEHGMQNLIEGEIKSGQRTVVVEDLVSTGKSSLLAVQALRKADADVIGLVSIFTYGFKKAEENFAEAKCLHLSLSNYDRLIQQAVESGYVSKEEYNLLRNWSIDPENWQGD